MRYRFWLYVGAIGWFWCVEFFGCVCIGLWFGCLLLVVNLVLCVCLAADSCAFSCGWFANCLVGWLLVSFLWWCGCVIVVLVALVCG